MKRKSDQISGYTGPNPFREGQSRTFADDKLLGEFYPTSIFLSSFNEQNEILLGSRGSGKTALLRMMSYTYSKRITEKRVREITSAKKYFGFYIPLHLEFIKSLPQKDEEQYIEYFQFAVNCIAVKGFLREIRSLIEDFEQLKGIEKLCLESELIDILCHSWQIENSQNISCIEDICGAIDDMYFRQRKWKDETLDSPPLFAQALFAPLLVILPRFCRKLDIDPVNCHWLACVDEAEFLKPAYLRCFNSFMRSERKPIVLKLATLPYKYSNLETLVPGIRVEAGGHDFNFRSIDLPWDSENFISLTNHLITKRLNQVNELKEKYQQDEIITLENFLGRLGKDDPKDYFKKEMGDDNSSDENILGLILEALSPERQERFEKIKDIPARIKSDYLKKYSPSIYLRELKKKSSKGNSKVGFFAGANIVRRISEGNPRRYIQVMNDMFEKARNTYLTPSTQHEIIASFAERECIRIAGLPGSGILLDEILRVVSEKIGNSVHEGTLKDSGINFKLSKQFLSNPEIISALELGVAYSFLFVDFPYLISGITEKTVFCLAHVLAIKYWLPMRKTTVSKLGSYEYNALFGENDFPELMKKIQQPKLPLEF